MDKPRSADFNERVAYVMQEELLFAFLGCRRAPRQAALRPSPDKEKAESRRRAASPSSWRAKNVIYYYDAGGITKSNTSRTQRRPAGQRCTITVEMVATGGDLLDEHVGADSFQAQRNVRAAVMPKLPGRQERRCPSTSLRALCSIFAMFDRPRAVRRGGVHRRRILTVGYGRGRPGCSEAAKLANLSKDFFMDVMTWISGPSRGG